ncbi:MAG: hypothetical protein WCX83_04645 [Candidatus Cloacimonas sp.]|nr:hypothetical protein [Candidatus Cloacimonadota bacterium]
MKSSLKFVAIGLATLSLFVTACSTPPQTVSRDQYQAATREVNEADENAAKSRRERDELVNEVSQKEAELKSLKEYERVIGN